MKTLTACAAFIAGVVAARPAAAQQTAPCGVCIAAVIAPGQALALPPALHGVDVLVEAAPGWQGAAAALRDIAARGGRAGLLVHGTAGGAVPAELASGAKVLLIELDDMDRRDTAVALAFRLKSLITQARAASSDLLVGLAGPVATLRSLLGGHVAAYVDFVAWHERPPAVASPRPSWMLSPGTVPVLSSVFAALEATRTVQAERVVYRAPAAVEEAASALHQLATLAALLPAGMVESSIQVTCGGYPAEAYLNPLTLETVAIARGCASVAEVAVTPVTQGIERVALGADSIIRVPASALGDRLSEGVTIVASRQLAVEEIVARHQAATARQAAALRTSIADGMLTISFEAPGFPAPISISSRTRIFASPDRTELEQRDITINGIAFRPRDVPGLPIIEPERVSSPPLVITLTDVYRYRLEGMDSVDGVACYVVAFEPAARRQSLFTGRAWISADDFGTVKVAATQTGLRGAIVASEQVDYFRRAGKFWLLARSDVRQMYEGPGHRTPIHRVLAIDGYETNPAGFVERRAAAYAASDSVMLRDTPDGYRYLEKPSGGTRSASGLPPASSTAPVLAKQRDSVRTVGAGVIIDPNISTPLPFAGLSYVDFDLLGTGTQINAFFGGSYGQLAFSIPGVGGTAWQLSGRAFAIASSYNDRSFSAGREQYELNIRQRPASLGVWSIRRLAPRVSLRLGYNLDYTRFSTGDSTSASFVVPADQVLHGALIALDLQRSGWNASAWWNPSRRVGWRPWGRAGGTAYRPQHADFQRYGASLGRSAVLSRGLIGRIEVAAMGGHDLDRFSRYSFGSFDNRLRGYPSALIRYDRGAVARSALAWAPGRLARIDLFADVARVRDPGFGRTARNYLGIATAIEAPAPFGTLLSVEWGYGFQAVNAEGGSGTHVVRVSAFKGF